VRCLQAEVAYKNKLVANENGAEGIAECFAKGDVIEIYQKIRRSRFVMTPIIPQCDYCKHYSSASDMRCISRRNTPGHTPEQT